MSSPVPITLKLGERTYTLRWTERAKARNASLARPSTFGMLAKRNQRLHALCAVVWSAIVEREHPFEEAHDLAEFFKDPECELAAIRAVGAIVAEAFPQKKTEEPVPSGSGPSSASSSGLTSGS